MTGRDVGSPLTHGQVLKIALPIVAMGMSTPLLGIVDTAVIGQLGDPALIGAVAVGALIFSFLFWAFGFLRMGTTGLTAQALGANDDDEIRASFGRALLIALVAGFVLIGLQYPLKLIAFELVQGSAAVETHALAYFDIRMWSAPFTLANYAVIGWLVGMQRTRAAMGLQIFMNSLNAALDALFVLSFGWSVEGIALGTILAEMTTALAGLAFVLSILRQRSGRWDWQRIVDPAKIARTLSVNRDIMVRTLLLLAAFTFFMMEGARAGDVTLAANAILMQFVSFSAFFLDGFAFAAEALVGAAIGSRSRRSFHETVKLTSIWSLSFSVLLSVSFLVGGGFWIDFLTTSDPVREAARTYLFWAALMPFISVACFQLDGIYIGATRSRDMRNAAFLSTASFFLFWWLFLPMDNHGLWAALMLFNIARALTLLRTYWQLVGSISAQGRDARKAT